MKDILYYNDLYDYYKNLLTIKQREYFEAYYFDNLSLTEIAENHEVSKNAISKQLKNVTNLLIDFEAKLQLSNKKKEVKVILEKNNTAEKQKEEILNLF